MSEQEMIDIRGRSVHMPRTNDDDQFIQRELARIAGHALMIKRHLPHNELNDVVAEALTNVEEAGESLKAAVALLKRGAC